MDQYIVTGMSGAACQARVEKAVGAVPGVTSCTVSLLTNSMGVEGTASQSAVIKAVTDAGYGAKPKDAAKKNAAKPKRNTKTEKTTKTGKGAKAKDAARRQEEAALTGKKPAAQPEGKQGETSAISGISPVSGIYGYFVP